MTHAIQTFYQGYRFRSRLEARWAVLLDFLRVRWEYEPQGFELSGLAFLPDFWIALNADNQHSYSGIPAERGFWLEIKGQFEPGDGTVSKCLRLACHTGHNVYLAAGNIGEHRCYKFKPGGGLRKFESIKELCIFDGENGSLDSLTFYLLDEASTLREGDPFDLAAAAYTHARSARFEHGERPRIFQ